MSVPIRRIIDLSHPITDGMVTYPGFEPPKITTYISREESTSRLASGVSYHVGRLEMIANTGTYLDTPRHFHANGYDTAGLPLHRVLDVPAVVIEAAKLKAIGPDVLNDVGELADHAVLFHTGWSRHWGSDAYFTNSPFLTEHLVAELIAANPAVVGIDSLNIDDATDPKRPAHQGLLGAGIPIIEHLTALSQLPARAARFTAIPAPVVGMGTMPVRAVAVVTPDTLPGDK